MTGKATYSWWDLEFWSSSTEKMKGVMGSGARWPVVLKIMVGLIVTQSWVSSSGRRLRFLPARQ